MRKPPRFSGQRMREARRKAGLSQYQLGDLIGWRQAAVSRLETGEVKSPSVERAAVIARAIGCRIEDLLDGMGPSKQEATK